MSQNQDTHGFEDRAHQDGVEIAQEGHPVAPVDERNPDDAVAASDPSTRADQDDLYRGMELLVTPGKDVDAARAATLR